jgi:hypothetical protein
VERSRERWAWPARRAVPVLMMAVALLPSIVADGRAQDRLSERRTEGDALPRTEPAGGPLPLRSYTDQEGRSCRLYERRVVIDGGPATALATVCRDPSGRWVLSR